MLKSQILVNNLKEQIPPPRAPNLGFCFGTGVVAGWVVVPEVESAFSVCPLLTDFFMLQSAESKFCYNYLEKGKAKVKSIFEGHTL